jgi:hypothetical protein
MHRTPGDGQASFSSDADVVVAGDPAELSARLKGISSTAYLTLMSIVQGAALADLAGVVINNYLHFTAVQWLLVVPTFLLIIAAWNQVTMDTVAWVQMPDVVGAVIPFLVGAVEFFLNHSLVIEPRAWLIGAAIGLMLSTVGIGYVERRAAEQPENAALLAHVKRYRQVGQRYNLVSSIVLLGLAVIGLLGLLTRFDAHVHHLSLTALIGGVVSTLILGGFLTRHFYYWRIVLAYARQQPPPPRAHVK